MLRIAVDELRPGMRIGKPVISANGRLLLQAGAEVRESYIGVLQRMGIPAIYVHNDLAPDVEPADVVSPEARQQLTAALKQTEQQIERTFQQSVRTGERRFASMFDTTQLRSNVNAIVDELLQNPHAMVNLQDIRLADEYTLGHSVNVCILSVLLGVQVGLNPSELRDLGVGALLHDVGKIGVPPDVLNKPGILSPEEFELMKQHPAIGWEILSAQASLSYISSAIALQHHERWQGGGYPRGMKGEAIHRFARIVAIVDCYDAMVSDRVYRKGMTSEQALHTLAQQAERFFDPQLFAAFCNIVAPYPVGSLVQLSNGLQAVVVGVKRGRATRPVVRVVFDHTGTRLDAPFELDLFGAPGIHILQSVTDAVDDGLLEELAG